MPVRKLKPVEAFDGTQQGLILGIFDQMEDQEAAKEAYYKRISESIRFGKFAEHEIKRLDWKANYMRQNPDGKLTDWQKKIDNDWKEMNKRIVEGILPNE